MYLSAPLLLSLPLSLLKFPSTVTHFEATEQHTGDETDIDSLLVRSRRLHQVHYSQVVLLKGKLATNVPLRHKSIVTFKAFMQAT